MLCPLCKETIDNDSRYCDQCGEQILVCSVCGRPGKGKRCIFDGKEMIPAGSVPFSGSVAASAPVPSAELVQPTQSPLAAQPVQIPLSSVQAVPIPMSVQAVPQNVAAIDTTGAANNTPGDNKIKLTSPIHGITIEAKDGDIIGRKNGAFANVFCHFNYVSGTHCKLVKTADSWHIQDMGSTNGTFYNGIQLVPNALYPILSNTTVKIADIELLVTYNAAGGGTVRL